jgi:hypothetical protein
METIDEENLEEQIDELLASKKSVSQSIRDRGSSFFKKASSGLILYAHLFRYAVVTSRSRSTNESRLRNNGFWSLT